jgi:small-conductance mechanosensitive channel
LALLALGPLLRSWLDRRGRSAIAADLGLLTWPLTVFELSMLLHVVVRSEAATERIGGSLAGVTSQLLTIVSVLGAGWAVVNGAEVAKRAWFRRLRIDVADNLRARSRRTQLQLIKRVADVFIGATTILVALLTLEPVRELGPALLAYAGIIGVVLGLAMREPIENLVAGLIVAVTEPVRIDDVVVIEGEWGNVEEINLTHAVVRIWDRRRLVLPTSYFLSESFENWTRHGTSVLGTVFLHADVGVEVDAVRAELGRIVEASPYWDRQDWSLQVTDLGETSVQLRAVVSAANAGDAWELRCEIRERLLPTLQSASAVPRLRTGHVDEGIDLIDQSRSSLRS